MGNLQNRILPVNQHPGFLNIGMSKRLHKKLRQKWDRLIATEGAVMGLRDCDVFLENKLVNDIFYKGYYKGEPCLVKCSSRAPDALLRGAALIEKIFEVDSSVVPRVFAKYLSSDRKMAFVVIQYLSGPSFSQICSDPNDRLSTLADGFAEDIRRIANVLRVTGIVHRDINQDNLLMGEDGHLKLIDFQFAIDRNDYFETSFMRRNWKYLFVVFAFSEQLGGATWNDIRALKLRALLMPQTAKVTSLILELESIESESVFTIPIPLKVHIMLWPYLLSLTIQRMFCFHEDKKNVLDKRIHRVKILISKKWNERR
jgi:serine/threonine protein kinase